LLQQLTTKYKPYYLVEGPRLDEDEKALTC
jgi:hypothetical protein